MKCPTPHKTLRSLLLLAALILAVQPLAAQRDTSGPHHFTLEEAVRYALRNQNNVLNARLNRQASLEKIREMRGKLFPHINVNGSLTDNLKLQTSYIPDFSGNPDNKIPVQFGTKFSSQVIGEATQTILNSDYFLGLRAAKVYDQLSVKDYERTAIATRVAVSNAFFNVLVNRESIRLTDANLVQISKALKDTRARYDEGVSERIDVDRLQVSYNKSENQRANLERLMAFSLELLKFEMGMPLQESLTLEDELKSFAREMPDSINYSVQDRPEYAMQRTQVELDKLNLKSKKLEVVPSLNAHINYGVNWFSDAFSDLYKTGFGASNMGLTLSLPLFTGTERLFQVKQREITLQQSQNNLSYLTQQIQLEVREAWTTYKNNSASLLTEEKNMALTQGVYDRVLLKFGQGVSSSLDVTTADSDLKQAQSDYIQALLNTLISKVKLDQAMGKIKPQ
ncbi:TolC family protein [Chitinophaga lutea]|uniref:TolC family protein n=1 Tax=Chitinophaga lutea TaxID=2488634 RepID=A0A3N4PVS3_9BACT|nr:TolC family protein [Chitinophaga lutea]RPE12732.1 TolC family protein [Chitinophaga lutea]